MAKISFLCHPGLTSFLGDITKWLEPNHSVFRCYSLEKDKVKYAIERSDIIFVEWANELLVYLTREGMLDRKRVIVRLHSYEVFTPSIRQIVWPAVSDLIFVAPHVQAYFNKTYPFVQAATKIRQHVIPNGVDLNRFKLIERPIGRNLCFLGDISYKKGLPLLLQAFSYLRKETSEDYHLWIGGAFQDERFGVYYDHIIPELGLEGSVHYKGRIEDVPAFLEDKDYIVCSSPWEGHPVNVIEGMACGLVPVIHNFPGAKDLYHPALVWSTVEDFKNIVVSSMPDMRRTCRLEVIHRGWTVEKQVERLEKVIG